MSATAPQSSDSSAAAEFLSELYAPAAAGFINIYTITDGPDESDWAPVTQPTFAAEHALRRAPEGNVYVSVAVRSERLPGKRRGNKDECSVLTAVYADIDIVSTNHKTEKALPPDETAAMEIVHAVGLDPSAVLHSGGGLQVYWLFDEAQPVDELDDFLARWNATLTRHADERGWHLDNVFDVPRMMRVPGTLNHKPIKHGKPAQPVEVFLARYDRRYTLAQIEAVLDDLPPAPEPNYTFDSSTPYIGPERPGDAFIATHTAEELLSQFGFIQVGNSNRNGDTYWKRPGSDSKYNIIAHREGQIANFSPNIPLPLATDSGPGNTVDVLGLYVHLAHGGDFSAAAKELSRQGYGAQSVDNLEFLKTIPWAYDPGTTTEPTEEGDVAEDETAWKPPEPFKVQVGCGPLFPLQETLPPWIADYVVDVCKQVAVPVDFAATMALGALSAITMNHVSLDLSISQMAQPLNLWIALGAESGASKSYAHKSMMAPLRRWVADKKEAYELETTQLKVELEVAKKELEAIQKAGAAQVSSGNSENLSGDLLAATIKLAAAENRVIINPHFTSKDITPESLPTFYAEHGGLAAIVSDEGEVIDMMAGMYAKENASVGDYIAGYDRGTVENTRKNSGTINVDDPCLTIAVMTQPMMLAKLGQHGYLAGKGIVPRFCLSVPPDTVGYNTFEHEEALLGPDAERITEQRQRVKARYEKTMLVLAETLAKHWYPEDLRLTVSPAAARLWVAWKKKNEPRLRRSGDLRKMAAWYQKIRTATFRTAALLHLAHDPDLTDTVVDVEDFKRAFVLAEYWVAHAKVLMKAWADAKAKDENRLADRAEELLKWLLENEGDDEVDGANRKAWSLDDIPLAVITRRLKNANALTKNEAVEVVEYLVEKGWMRVPGVFFERARRDTRGGPRKGEQPLTVRIHPETEVLLESEDLVEPEFGYPDSPDSPELSDEWDTPDSPVSPDFRSASGTTEGVRGNRGFGVEGDTTFSSSSEDFLKNKGVRLSHGPHPRTPVSPYSTSIYTEPVNPPSVVEPDIEDGDEQCELF